MNKTFRKVSTFNQVYEAERCNPLCLTAMWWSRNVALKICMLFAKFRVSSEKEYELFVFKVFADQPKFNVLFLRKDLFL